MSVRTKNCVNMKFLESRVRVLCRPSKRILQAKDTKIMKDTIRHWQYPSRCMPVISSPAVLRKLNIGFFLPLPYTRPTFWGRYWICCGFQSHIIYMPQGLVVGKSDSTALLITVFFIVFSGKTIEADTVRSDHSESFKRQFPSVVSFISLLSAQDVDRSWYFIV